MFCDKSQIQKFDFAYEHRSHGYKNYDEVSDSSGIKVKKIKNMKKLNSNTITGAPASYHTLLARYNTSNFDYIIEGGSRDCADAIKLNYATNKKVYAFECNPTCVEICKKNLDFNEVLNNQVELISKALYHKNTLIDFIVQADTPNPPFGKNAPNLIDIDGKKANI